MSEKVVPRDVNPKKVASAAKTLASNWTWQRGQKKFTTVLTLRLSDSQGTLVDWCIARNSNKLRSSNPFTECCAGWNIQRERAVDDPMRSRRALPVSPESLLGVEERATTPTPAATYQVRNPKGESSTGQASLF